MREAADLDAFANSTRRVGAGRCLESDAESKKRVTYKTLTAVQRSTRVVLAASLPPGTLTKPALARGEPWSGELPG